MMIDLYYIVIAENEHIGDYVELYEQFNEQYHSTLCECGMFIEMELHQYSNISTYARPNVKTCLKCGYVSFS